MSIRLLQVWVTKIMCLMGSILNNAWNKDSNIGSMSMISPLLRQWLVACYGSMGNDFLCSTVTCNESWVQHQREVEPESYSYLQISAPSFTLTKCPSHTPISTVDESDAPIYQLQEFNQSAFDQHVSFDQHSKTSKVGSLSMKNMQTCLMKINV